MSIKEPHKGQILVAELALTGSTSFSRAIIFLAEHNEEGSVGFVVNKETQLKLSDLIPDINRDFALYQGGPVDQDNLYFIHKIPEILPGSMSIDDDIYWGGDFDILQKELKAGTIPNDKIKFFLGYSGWMPHQLNDEIQSNSWIVCENDKDLFRNDASIWKDKLLELGGEYLIWANSPENPGHN